MAVFDDTATVRIASTQDFTNRFENEEYEVELFRRNFLISQVPSRWTWTTEN